MKRAQKPFWLALALVGALGAGFWALHNPLARSVQASAAQSYSVTNLNDSGPGSLRQAINSTPRGGTITFAPTLTGAIILSSELFIRDDLTIIGPTSGAVSLDGANRTRVMRIEEPANVSIYGLTIKNGSATRGGGIYTENRSLGNQLHMFNCTLAFNAATERGGAICMEVSSGTILEMVNCTVYGNWSGDNNGAIAASTASAEIYLTNCTITGNTGSIGSYSWPPLRLNMRNSIVYGNSNDLAPFTTFNSQGYNLIGYSASGTHISPARIC